MKEEDRARALELLAKHGLSDGFNLPVLPGYAVTVDPNAVVAAIVAAFATPSPVIETEGGGDEAAKARAIRLVRDLVVELETWEPELLEVLRLTPQAKLLREWIARPAHAERSTDREALLSRELIGEAAEAGYRQGYGDGVEDATPEGERPYVDGVGQSEGWMQWRDDVLPTLFPSKRSAVELAATSGQDDVIAVLAPAAILALRPVGAENVRERALEEAAMVAQSRAMLIPSIAPEAAIACLEALPDAIRALITPTAGNGENNASGGADAQPALVNEAPAGLHPTGFDQAQGEEE